MTEVFQTFSATSFLSPFSYISSGDTFLQNPDDVNVIVWNDCSHTFVGFSDKVCLSDAEKLPTTGLLITVHQSCVMPFQGMCAHGELF